MQLYVSLFRLKHFFVICGNHVRMLLLRALEDMLQGKVCVSYKAIDCK